MAVGRIYKIKVPSIKHLSKIERDNQAFRDFKVMLYSYKRRDKVFPNVSKVNNSYI